MDHKSDRTLFNLIQYCIKITTVWIVSQSLWYCPVTGLQFVIPIFYNLYTHILLLGPFWSPSGRIRHYMGKLTKWNQNFNVQEFRPHMGRKKTRISRYVNGSYMFAISSSYYEIFGIFGIFWMLVGVHVSYSAFILSYIAYLTIVWLRRYKDWSPVDFFKFMEIVFHCIFGLQV